MVFAWMDKVRANLFLYLLLSITDTEGHYRYIDETLEQDRTKFKPIPTVNPFLTDFVADGTEGAGGINDGGVVTLSTIGSMQGIVGIL